MQIINVLAFAGVAAAAYQAEPVTSYSTSTQYMTATVTLTQCNPTNTDCPLYTPPPKTSSSTTSTISTTSTSSSAVHTTSSSSVFSYPVHNTTTSSQVYPTIHHNATTAYPTTIKPSTYPVVPVVPTTPNSPPAQTTIPVSGAGVFSVQSGLLMGVVGLGAALLA